MAASSSRSVHGGTPPAPTGWLGLHRVEIKLPWLHSDATRHLCDVVFRRSIGSAQGVAQLIRQEGAEANVMPLLVQSHADGAPPPPEPPMVYPLLSLAIDNMTGNTIPSIWVDRPRGMSPVATRCWSSPELQDDIMNALIDGGADMNATSADRSHNTRPLRVAIAAGNIRAVSLLLRRGAQLSGFRVMRLPFAWGVYGGRECLTTSDAERQLMSIYQRLIQRDSTLAVERSTDGGSSLSVVDDAATSRGGPFSQAFIDQYLDMLQANGADVRAGTGPWGTTPLRWAAMFGSPQVADWLCRQVPADIDRDLTGEPHRTPLNTALGGLTRWADDLNDDSRPEHEKEELRTREIPNLEAFIRTLVRAGLAPSLVRFTVPEDHRRRCRLLLTQYAAVLNELPDVSMAAINAALARQRDHSMLLARLLPVAPHHDGAHPHPSPSNMAFGPHEADAIGWKIGAFLHDPSAAVAVIDRYLIGDSQLRRRVQAAVSHFVKSAATQTSSNREVVGDMANVGGVTGRVPLQCFAIRGSGVQVARMVGVREVVHRARLDEAARWLDGAAWCGLTAGVVKGFNEHLGNQDCQFAWQQLGHIDKTTRIFVALGIE
ncbi:unnamed protein product [Vitrella brassicaformis CCMP3155]|uniref:Uncharacterized protein n=1 Tax=Vitrella brassicaformis (strain CCMP3155) TaxID=1169540 RepID=A0A0G4G7Y5_VITBC|nr:unnamed protein product [Vitrella brassicaformis CCMP3155]|eukprot:CEM24733.1 unnamed protein product [Vitrella brassicaformis CCMP3155]